jgi:hypothetical protein
MSPSNLNVPCALASMPSKPWTQLDSNSCINSLMDIWDLGDSRNSSDHVSLVILQSEQLLITRESACLFNKVPIFHIVKRGGRSGRAEWPGSGGNASGW